MASKTVSFNAHCNLCDSHLESIAKWVSCNGEVWGVGPTAVFASAAALFLYNELEATIFMPGDQAHVSLMEKTLISTMVLGMLALMVHLWVCSMRFFKYYLDTLIRDSPSMLLEMTTAGLLGSQTTDMVPLGPLTRFLRQQQPQIHITVCWFLSLCYADYVRKHYCQRFNMPYLEQWQTQLHERATRNIHHAMQKAHSFVGCVHQRLRGYTSPANNAQRPTCEAHTVRAVPASDRRRPVPPPAAPPGAPAPPTPRARSCACGLSVSPARAPQMLLRNLERILRRPAAHVAVLQTPRCVALARRPPRKRSESLAPVHSWLHQPTYILMHCQ
ncbi:hypothetical protein O3G_MSEX000003 [Manduca sexta]|nr:hypothetical protein O3G_MSEX000003 [Manduca sexta]